MRFRHTSTDATRSKRTNSFPLRRIVDYVDDDYGLTCELLECGHVVAIKQDIIGLTNATKRRCRRCAKDIPNA